MQDDHSVHIFGYVYAPIGGASVNDQFRNAGANSVEVFNRQDRVLTKLNSSQILSEIILDV